MISENQNLINNILPMFEYKARWDRSGMAYEVMSNGGRIDLLYSVNGKRMAVVEVKRPSSSRSGEERALEQAVKYAKATNTPIAIATDGEHYLKTHQLKENKPLLDYKGHELGLQSIHLLKDSNLIFFKSQHSLEEKAKSDIDEIRGVFNKLNKHGRDIGLTSGVERVVEIAKIIFIKMLCDNNIILDSDNWNFISSEKNKIWVINKMLEKVKEDSSGDVEITDLIINNEKNDIVSKIIELLSEVDLNYEHYDVTGSLFQEFLSEKARGGSTNDLGQYFTPKKIISLVYELSEYKEGKTIYDPFCGTGGILTEFFLQNTDSFDEYDKRNFGKDYLFGSEISRAVSLLAKMNMVLVGDGHSNIENKDSLSLKNGYMEKDSTFDIIATNMPFAPSTPDDVPEKYFKISLTSGPIANFIEHCLLKCKKGGKIILIVGKGFLSENKSADFRKELLKKYNLEAIYMLYEGLFEPYTQAFSCMLVISNTIPDPKSYIDFFSIKDDNSIGVVKKYHLCQERYKNGFYKVKREDILNSKNCDLRGRLYIQRKANFTIGDLVEYIEPVEDKNPNFKLKKMTTPNSIEDGIQMMETRSNKQVKEGIGSFKVKLQADAIVVSRITNRRKDSGRYLGSAMVGKNAGNLITREYHQFKLKDSKDLFYILACLRGNSFQEIVELASGTGGQQRIAKDIILKEPIQKPTPDLREKAKEYIEGIEIINKRLLASIREREEIKEQIKNFLQA